MSIKKPESIKQEAIRLLKQGIRMGEISKNLDVSVGALKHWRVEAKIPPRKKNVVSSEIRDQVADALKNGATITEVSQKFGVSPTWIRYQPFAPKPTRLDKSVIEAALIRISNGERVRDVAGSIGASHDGLRYWMDKAGIKGVGRGHRLAITAPSDTIPPGWRTASNSLPPTKIPAPVITPTPEQIEASVFNIVLRGMKNRHSDEEYDKLSAEYKKLSHENEKIHNELHNVLLRHMEEKENSLSAKLRGMLEK